MDTNVLLFFEKHQGALPLYEKLEKAIQREIDNVTVKVQKTQITFRERYGFAFVSLRRMKGCPEVFLILSFGLSHRLDSPRILAAVEPYPNRWTHHVLIQREDELDEELMGWLEEAHTFALTK